MLFPDVRSNTRHHFTCALPCPFCFLTSGEILDIILLVPCLFCFLTLVAIPYTSLLVPCLFYFLTSGTILDTILSVPCFVRVVSGRSGGRRRASTAIWCFAELNRDLLVRHSERQDHVYLIQGPVHFVVSFVLCRRTNRGRFGCPIR